MKTYTRKTFLKASLIGSAAAALSRTNSFGSAVAAKGSPNGDIRVAVVGFNGKGNAHIKAFSSMKGVKLAALCDVDSTVMARRVQELDQRNLKVTTYTDYRKLLDDPTIDAVAIATPNHWHSLMAVWACQAGKDVYVEKPISHNVWEGRKVVEAAKKYNRIVQTGTQSRSDEALQEAFAYIAAGNLGKIKWARGLCYKARESIGKTSGPQPVPSSVDYDLWCGPAPLEAPRRNSESRGPIHYDWHWFWAYGGGDIANQGIHEMDMCRWAMGESGLPKNVMSIGGRFGYDDDAETPNTQIAVYEYDSAPLIFEVRGLPRKKGEKAMGDYRHGVRVGITIQCENGYFAGGAGGGFIYDNNGKRVKQFSSAGGGGHQANFIAAMRSRKTTDLSAPVIEGHLSSSLCHLGNISYRLGVEKGNDAIREAVQSNESAKESFGRMLEHLEANGVDTKGMPSVIGPTLSFNPEKEKFASSEKYDLGFWANTMLKRTYRPPFVVPEVV